MIGAVIYYGKNTLVAELPKHLPRDIVPQFIQRAEDGRKRPALVMR